MLPSKVGTADADRREGDVLSHLTTKDHSSTANKSSMVPVALDRFSIDGPNDTHPCFVAVPARCSLMDAKEASGSRLLQLDVARSLAAQLAIAISFVHSQDFAHGDLHLGNLLFQLPSSLNNLSVEPIYTKFGEPEPEPVICLDGRKSSFFEPTTPLSFASDIWSLGCVIFELLAHRSLIDGILTPQDEITAQQVHLQGPLPSEWWDKWEQRCRWFDEAGRPLSNECDVWSWNRRFEQWVQEPRRSYGLAIIDEEESAALLELLHWMLAWKPGERPNAEEVLGTAWMEKWALPAYWESRKAWVQDL